MPKFLFLLMLLIVSCSGKIASDKLHYLNGYWEIETVEFPDGTTKEYPMNTVVDYIEIQENTGFRKKLVPRFDGTFETSDDAESFSIIEDSDNFYMRYKNPLSEWQETVLSLSEDSFSVENPEGITYRFKRFEPIKPD